MVQVLNRLIVHLSRSPWTFLAVLVVATGTLLALFWNWRRICPEGGRQSSLGPAERSDGSGCAGPASGVLGCCA